MSKNTTKFVPQSEASKRASNDRFKRFALGPLTELYKANQKKDSATPTGKGKGLK